MKIIINGLGRICKLVFRWLCDKGLYKNILLVNGQRGFGNGLCLPAGPLRELIKPAIKKADFLIIVGEDDTHIEIKLKNTRGSGTARSPA